ncbi:MAG TPA: type II toxin-antitoxin system RelE/ParE family toxin [bacterium]
MPEFAVVPSKRFEDDFRTLSKDTPRQVLNAIGRIRANPHRGQKLRGVRVGEWRYHVGEWRYRVGDYRIRYDIRGPHVYLHVVRHRKDLYR